jgi:hypothetical protein
MEPKKILRRYYREYTRKQGHLPHPYHIAARADAKLQKLEADIAGQVALALGYEIKYRKLLNSYQQRKLPKIWINGHSCRLLKITN